MANEPVGPRVESPPGMGGRARPCATAPWLGLTGAGRTSRTRWVTAAHAVQPLRTMLNTVMNVLETLGNAIPEFAKSVAETTASASRTAGAATADVARSVGSSTAHAAKQAGSATYDAAKVARDATFDAARVAGPAIYDAARVAGHATYDAAKVARDATMDAARTAGAATAHAAKEVADRASDLARRVPRNGWIGIAAAAAAIGGTVLVVRYLKARGEALHAAEAAALKAGKAPTPGGHKRRANKKQGTHAAN